jgi:hypothetical protein
MTTPAAANLYLAQHLFEMEGKGFAVYNPNNLPLDQLPVIYGFNNGGYPGWLSAVALAEDGTVLGGHCCSNEGYMPHDLGILEGTRLDRHEESYRPHYPNGYRMEFVSSEDFSQHDKLKAAISRHQEKANDRSS